MSSHPLTTEQLKQLTEDLATMYARSEEISVLMSAVYGDYDLRAIRAAEVVNSTQRLLWAIERTPKADAASK